MEQIQFEDFLKVDMRVGRILSAEPSPKARKPAYRLSVDLGPLGVKQTSAQITDLYSARELVGRLVVAVVNFPPRQVADVASEVLVLGVDGHGDAAGVVLLQPERDVSLGARVY